MRTQKGFTLIELAVVIAIIAILAAVAIPRFADTTAQAERSMIKDMTSQLISASSIYTAEQAATPTGFLDYVSTTGTAIKPKTIDVKNFGGGTCIPSAATISGCTFKKYSGVTYSWNNGSISVTATPAAGAPAL